MTQNDLATEVVQEWVKEKRRDRFWKNIRFFMGFFLIALIVFLFASSKEAPVKYINNGGSGYVSLLRFGGMIESGGDFSSEAVLPLLRDAFADSQSKGVILDINSGGGSPVQSAIIHDAIIELKNKYHKKVIVVGEDSLASGAYYISVAADKIYVNPNTLTGSVGVVMRGFGFPEALKKIGVERRVYTAGANKDRLDPFLPQTMTDIEKIKSVINEVHQNFMQVVLAGRKDKLKASSDVLFSGDFWSGQTALKLGLVDGLGNISDVLKKEFNVSQYKEYGTNQSFLKAVLNQVGASVSLGLAQNQQLKLQEAIE